MDIYLIDYENGQEQRLKGIDNLDSKTSKVFLFHNTSNKIHCSIVKLVEECIEVKTGIDNALDFQLCSSLGYFISKEPDSSFFIITLDKYGDFIANCWKNHASVKCFSTIDDALKQNKNKQKQTTNKKSPTKEEIVKKLKSSLRDKSDVEIKGIFTSIKNSSSYKDFQSKKLSRFDNNTRNKICSIINTDIYHSLKTMNTVSTPDNKTNILKELIKQLQGKNSVFSESEIKGIISDLTKSTDEKSFYKRLMKRSPTDKINKIKSVFGNDFDKYKNATK